MGQSEVCLHQQQFFLKAELIFGVYTKFNATQFSKLSVYGNIFVDPSPYTINLLIAYDEKNHLFTGGGWRERNTLILIVLGPPLIVATTRRDPVTSDK